MTNTSRVVLVSNFYNEYLPHCWGGAMANKSVVASCIFCLNGPITCCLNCSTNTIVTNTSRHSVHLHECPNRQTN